MQIWKIDMTYLAQLDISSYIKLKGQIKNKFLSCILIILFLKVLTLVSAIIVKVKPMIKIDTNPVLICCFVYVGLHITI